jgi:uncharacterized protein involved in exopolysaccharide biosynthesis
MDTDERLEARIERLMETLAMTHDRLVEIQADTTESLQHIEGLLRQILAAVTKD